MSSSHHYDVVIIGAGVAGLYAARQLSQKGITNTCVVEAQEAIGGRITQVHGVAPWPLEAGPEFIHGAKSLLVDVCKDMGMNLSEVEWPDHIYWGDEKRLVRACQDTNPEFKQLDEMMFVELPKQELPEPDVSIAHWMRRLGTPARVQELADVCYSNDFACSLKDLGMTEAIIESRKWDAGEEYLLKDRSLRHLVAHLAKGIVTRTRWPVKCIEWVAGQGARVSSTTGEVLSCRAVICTVPITQLQNRSIQFAPPMPAEQEAALHRVRMGNAVKVFGVFSERFWPEDLWDVVCPHRLLPELWVTRYPVEDASLVDPVSAHCITAFCTGDRARKIAELTPAAAVQQLVEQLDEMFGSAADPRPAARAFVRGYVRDWSKTPYINGAYTHPSLGARPGDRGLIASSLGGVVFFAGEHTQLAINPCLQGAMETGDRAAAEVFHALQRPIVVSRL